MSCKSEEMGSKLRKVKRQFPHSCSQFEFCFVVIAEVTNKGLGLDLLLLV